MANTTQARKRARQNITRRIRNMAQRSVIRTDIKRLLKQIEEKNIDAAKAAYSDATSSIDRGVRKFLVSKNRAARLKQRLNTRLRALSAAPSA